MSTLLFKDLGVLEFLAAYELQQGLVKLKQCDPTQDILLFVEHPHAYTLGRGGDESNILAPAGVPVHRTSRGGDVTYHGPGQLVVYPIVDLRSKLRKDVHRYVRNLEFSAIRMLHDFGLTATRRPPLTGLWIGNRKIAAIGVAVRRCITYHGLALNVNCDLEYFKRIIPCGLTWAEVTSLEKELGTKQSVTEARVRFLRHFAKIFGYSKVEEYEFTGGNLDDRDLHSSILDPRSPTSGTIGTTGKSPST